MPQLPEPTPGTSKEFLSPILPVQDNFTPVTYAQAVSSTSLDKNHIDSGGKRSVQNKYITKKNIKKKKIQEPSLEEYLHDENMSTEIESSVCDQPVPEQKKKKGRSVFLFNPTPANLNKLQEKTRKSQKLIRNAKSKRWWEFCSSLNEISSASEMWRRMQWLKDYRSAKRQIDKCIAESLLCSLTPDYVSQSYPGYTSHNLKLETEISRSELFKCLKSKDTCPGVDDISYSMFLIFL
ncbi:unnamed protein product [Parnassius mnemosyne]|uniref:Uncharacterized protein n=1 Tax=Parnassius mnemosyne TaxID=213953 RepID=A0AAV1K605_9NEOP